MVVLDQRHYRFKPPPSGGFRIWAGWGCSPVQILLTQVSKGLLKSVGFRFCRPLQELEKAGHVLRYFVNACSIGRKLRCQVTIDHRASHLRKQMGATWRPAHVLALAHACIDHLGHRRLRQGRRSQLALAIVLPVSDRRAGVAFQGSEQLAKAIVELLEAPRESKRLWHNDATE